MISAITLQHRLYSAGYAVSQVPPLDPVHHHTWDLQLVPLDRDDAAVRKERVGERRPGGERAYVRAIRGEDVDRHRFVLDRVAPDPERPVRRDREIADGGNYLRVATDVDDLIRLDHARAAEVEANLHLVPDGPEGELAGRR